MRARTRVLLLLAAAGGLLVASACTADDPVKPAAEAVTDKEKAFLGRVHHNAVEIFVDRPGFGVRRLVPNLDDLLTRPKSLSEDEGAKGALPDQLPQPAAGKPSHFAVRDLLTKGFGRFPTDDGKEAWEVREVYLVGLVAHPKPVAYTADGNPKTIAEKPKDPKTIPTRELNAFETAALTAVRDGEPLKAEKSGKEMRLFAPIFAGKRCTGCHDRGAMLGGFSYELERVAHDPEKDGRRR